MRLALHQRGSHTLLHRKTIPPLSSTSGPEVLATKSDIGCSTRGRAAGRTRWIHRDSEWCAQL